MKPLLKVVRQQELDVLHVGNVSVLYTRLEGVGPIIFARRLWEQLGLNWKTHLARLRKEQRLSEVYELTVLEPREGNHITPRRHSFVRVSTISYLLQKSVQLRERWGAERVQEFLADLEAVFHRFEKELVAAAVYPLGRVAKAIERCSFIWRWDDQGAHGGGYFFLVGDQLYVAFRNSCEAACIPVGRVSVPDWLSVEIERLRERGEEEPVLAYWMSSDACSAAFPSSGPLAQLRLFDNGGEVVSGDSRVVLRQVGGWLSQYLWRGFEDLRSPRPFPVLVELTPSDVERLFRMLRFEGEGVTVEVRRSSVYFSGLSVGRLSVGKVLRNRLGTVSLSFPIFRFRAAIRSFLSVGSLRLALQDGPTRPAVLTMPHVRRAEGHRIIMPLLKTKGGKDHEQKTERAADRSTDRTGGSPGDSAGYIGEQALSYRPGHRNDGDTPAQ